MTIRALGILAVGALGTAAALLPAVAEAAGPVGAITSVTCEGIEGWAYDPDHPADAIDVHLYFDGPAGDPVANAIAVRADEMLAAGCSGDACAHGFRSPLPLSRLDEQPHAIHAYGIDFEDPNLELSQSPGSMACPPLALTMGLKRHVASPPVLQAWAWSTFFDLMPIADLDLAALPVGPTIDAAPELVVDAADPGALWLLDQGFRRAVEPEAAAAWRIDPATAIAMPSAMLQMLDEGTPLPARPILIQGSGAAVYLLDEPQCAAGDENPACAAPPEEPDAGDTGGSDGGTGRDGGDDGGQTGGSDGFDDTLGDETPTTGAPADDADDAAGGGCRIGAPRRVSAAWWLVVLAIGRRRQARA